jgi:hypothetical protein
VRRPAAHRGDENDVAAAAVVYRGQAADESRSRAH